MTGEKQGKSRIIDIKFNFILKKESFGVLNKI